MQIIHRQAIVNSALDANLPSILDRVLRQRGVQSVAEIDMQVKHLFHFNQLKGIDKASEILVNAIKQKKRICIVGDFDADGATSIALCMLCLRDFGHHHVHYIVPNRFDYGYGLSPEVVSLAVQEGSDVLITVDNGISSIAGAQAGKDAGLELIITDHHLPAEQAPNADAIINPNQHGCHFPSKSLAGVGVAFYLMLALRAALIKQNYFEESGIAVPNIANYLDIVALGTVADVVPLDRNNRILVHQGLQRIRVGRTRLGIQALLDISGRKAARLASSDLGFALGPRLNAAGRLEDMSVGIECLLTEDMQKARALAAELDSLNKSRQDIEKSMQDDAEKAIKSCQFSRDNLPSAISVYDESFHVGVVGIVAGRIKEKYHRPCIVFAQENEHSIKGSARSIPGIHIRDLLDNIATKHPGLITKFGGHAMAAGLSMPLENYTQFAKCFDQEAQIALQGVPCASQIFSDGELDAYEISLQNAQLLKCALPWGQAFEAPVFDGVFELVQQRIVGEKHLKMVVKKGSQIVDAIAFNVDLQAWPNQAAQKIHLVYQLDVNEFNHRTNVQLIVDQLFLA